MEDHRASADYAFTEAGDGGTENLVFRIAPAKECFPPRFGAVGAFQPYFQWQGVCRWWFREGFLVHADDCNPTTRPALR